jgi:hypothetical protein
MLGGHVLLEQDPCEALVLQHPVDVVSPLS